MLGDLFIKAGVSGQEYDAYEHWGVGLEDGALDALMGFKPNKEPIVNKNVTHNGAFYVAGAGFVDERTVSVPFHIVAIDKADFLLKREGFYNAIRSGLLTIRIQNPIQATYQMYYVSCSQYSQFLDGMAKFVLTLYETNDYTHDSGSSEIAPMPITQDLSQYLHDLLNLYGRIATREQIEDIINNYDFSKVRV